MQGIDYLKQQNNDNRDESDFLNLSVLHSVLHLLEMFSPGGYGNYEKQGKNYYTFIKMTERKMVKPEMLAKQP